jgi:hypothetical protein
MGVVMTDNKIRPTLKRGLLAGAVLVIALVATTGTALAERPVEGHWQGTQGVHFHVAYTESHYAPTLVKHIHFYGNEFADSALFKEDRFESCYSFVNSPHAETHTCIDGQFTSHHHASGTVIVFITPPGHPHIRHHRHRYEWTASPVDG